MYNTVSTEKYCLQLCIFELKTPTAVDFFPRNVRMHGRITKVNDKRPQNP